MKKKQRCKKESDSGVGSAGNNPARAEATPNECHCPSGCLVKDTQMTRELIDSGDESLVRTLCSNDKCTKLNAMHKQCFDSWEKEMFDICKKQPQTRDWGDHWVQNQLWCDKRGYPLIYRRCHCPCGGNLRKDLTYYQMLKAQKEPAKKVAPKKAKIQQPSAGVMQPKKAYRMKHTLPTVSMSVGQIDSDSELYEENKRSLPVGMSSTVVQKNKKKRRQRATSMKEEEDNKEEDVTEDSQWEDHSHLLENQYPTLTCEPNQWLEPNHKRTVRDISNAPQSMYPKGVVSENRFMMMNGSTEECSNEILDPMLMQNVSVDMGIQGLLPHIDLGKADVHQYKVTYNIFSTIIANIIDV